MDPRITQVLALLKKHDGELLVAEAGLDRTFPAQATERAEEMGLIKSVSDGAGGAYEGFKLTRKGWRALGVEPPPTIFSRLWGMIRQAA